MAALGTLVYLIEWHVASNDVASNLRKALPYGSPAASGARTPRQLRRRQ
jgi:hypothetical protein